MESSNSGMISLSHFSAIHHRYRSSHEIDRLSPDEKECFSILLIDDGTATISDGADMTFNAGRGDIMFFPQTARYIVNFTGTPNISYSIINFTVEYITSFSSSRNYQIHKLQFDDISFLRREIYRIVNDYTEKRFLSSAGNFFILLEHIKDRLEYTLMAGGEHAVLPAIEYIRQNFNQKISDDYLSELCHLSKSRFHVLFKNVMGKAPIAYKIEVAIEHACQMLTVDKATSIEDISSACGFSSPSFFRRTFLRIKGISARDYRKKHCIL